MQEYVDNHIITARYLHEFTDESGRLMVHRADGRGDHAFLANPRSVGFRRYFWGYSPSLRRVLERGLADLEAAVAPTLTGLRSSWPMPEGSDERLSLGTFIAAHLLRTPGWKQLVPELGERFIRENELFLERRFGKTASEMLSVARSDDWRADLFIDELDLLGRMLATMHWTLVAFERPALITSDQPVVAVPFDDAGAGATVAPLPSAGLLHTLEFRFAPGPNDLLILTWIESKEETEILCGTPWVAATANRAVRAQADMEWFHWPSASPLFTAPPFLESPTPTEPIAPLLKPFYSATRALNSARRLYVERQVHDEVDKEIPVELAARFGRRAA